jgi:hypothetical protein
MFLSEVLIDGQAGAVPQRFDDTILPICGACVDLLTDYRDLHLAELPTSPGEPIYPADIAVGNLLVMVIIQASYWRSASALSWGW